MLAHDDDAIKAKKAGVLIANDMTTSAATTKLMNITGQMPKNMPPEDQIAYIRKEMIEKNYA